MLLIADYTEAFYTIYKWNIRYIQCKPISSSIRKNGSLVTWTVVCLTAAKFKSSVSFMSGLALSNIANILIILTLYDFCLLPAKFCCVVIYVRNIERHMQYVNRCAPWKIANGAENFVLQALQFY
jgi:hypothetical protein